jgi:hypothetical protein
LIGLSKDALNDIESSFIAPIDTHHDLIQFSVEVQSISDNLNSCEWNVQNSKCKSGQLRTLFARDDKNVEHLETCPVSYLSEQHMPFVMRFLF